jgi:lipopolysaccharide transport protein LptA
VPIVQLSRRHFQVTANGLIRLIRDFLSLQCSHDCEQKKCYVSDNLRFLRASVIIDVDNGHIECDSADLEFDNNTLMLATIHGSPATFELKRADVDEVTYAEAGVLKYDLATGIVEFSENAVITEGGNQISSSFLVYNISEQRINAQSSGDGDEKVKITYTPNSEDLPTVDATAGDDSP